MNNKELIDKYFEGTLTEDQERELKDFIASPEGQASEFDEVRAVMSFFATGRSLRKSKSKGVVGGLILKTAAVAAIVGILISVGFGIDQFKKQNVCVSYVNGVKVTDSGAVMGDVENTLESLFSEGTDVERQLNELMNN